MAIPCPVVVSDPVLKTSPMRSLRRSMTATRPAMMSSMQVKDRCDSGCPQRAEILYLSLCDSSVS